MVIMIKHTTVLALYSIVKLLLYPIVRVYTYKCATNKYERSLVMGCRCKQGVF